MFGVVETLIGYLQRQLGKRGDTASDSGSLHAKIGDLKNTVNSKSTIKSIQRGSATLSTAGGTYTVSAVDPSKSFLTFSISTSNTSGLSEVGLIPRSGFVKGNITNGTTLNFTRFSSDFTIYIEWQLIEYY